MAASEDFRVKRMPVHEQVFNRLKDALAEGRWGINEKIPTEVELSEMFGVNRLTVRMALQRLIGMGLLETRVGDGTYVKEFSFRDYAGNVSEFYLGTDLLDKICEFRDAIETSSLKLAVVRATDEEIDSLAALCDHMDEAKAKYVKSRTAAHLSEFIDSDIEFHARLCALSHNDLFVYSFDMARSLIRQYMDYLVHDRTGAWIKNAAREKPEDDRHRLTYQALRERDLEKCLKHHGDIIDYQIKL